MTRDLVGRVASAVAGRLRTDAPAPGCPDDAGVEALAASIVDEIIRSAASDPAGPIESDEFDAILDGLGDADIEAIASQLAEAMAPLLDRQELPADKVQI